MKYHAKLVYGTDNHFWYNWGKDEIVKELLIPFINGHVVFDFPWQGEKVAEHEECYPLDTL